MLLWLLVVPLLGALLAALVGSGRTRPWIVPVVALAHAACVAACLSVDPPRLFGGWLGLDPLGRLVLVQVSGIFALCSFYTPGYLALRPDRDNRVFCASLMAFLAAMTLAVLARHLGLLWVAIEASTLASAPLLYFNRNQRSIEATWKYLLVGSVGIALALLGSFFLAYAAYYVRLETTLVFDDLALQAPRLSKPWLHAAIVLLFVGYGTKMGLAPMHTWKPDAYGEAPGLVGTLLAGAMTSCAFLALLRVFQIAILAGEGDYARELLLGFGMFSMAVAGVFMVRQNDFKRMLAYSSVEHMGILVLGLAIGGGATFGSLFHMLNNGFTKGVLFLCAGNIHRAYDSKYASEVQGALHRTPMSAGLFLAGFFAITGAPPFGPFFSELTILDAAIRGGRFLVAGFFLLFLLIVFIGMGTTVLQVVQGEPPAPSTRSVYRDGWRTTLPILAFLAVSLLLGVHPPEFALDLLSAAAAQVEGK